MKIPINEKSIILIMAGIAMLFISCSFKPSPKKIVEDFISTKNQSNISKALEYVADDGVLEIPNAGIKITGKEARREIFEYDSSLQTVLTPSDFIVRGDTVLCSMTEHNNWIEAAEVPDAYHPHVIFVVKNDKIVYTYADLADSSRQHFRDVLTEFIPWAKEKYPEKMEQLMPDGKFAYKAENADLVVELLCEWRSKQAKVNSEETGNAN